MRLLKTWVRGEKHPDTPVVVYINLVEHDRIHRVLMARCKICGYVVSRDEKAVKEAIFICDKPDCDCKKMYGAISHQVCNLCYDMFRALYVNYGMGNMNYFKNIDEKEKKEREDPKRKDRLGL